MTFVRPVTMANDVRMMMGMQRKGMTRRRREPTNTAMSVKAMGSTIVSSLLVSEAMALFTSSCQHKRSQVV